MDWIETVLFAILASVKFAITVPAFILGQKLPFWQAVLFAISSGTFGIITFMFLSSYLLEIWFWSTGKLGFKKSKKKKRVFTGKNRRIVALKTRYGLIGIALLSPVLLSIPIGTFVAVRYYKNKKRVFLFLFSGVVIWSFIFATFGSAILNFFKSANVSII